MDEDVITFTKQRLIITDRAAFIRNLSVTYRTTCNKNVLDPTYKFSINCFYIYSI